MLFISSHSILYPQYRSDPIFPAREQDKFEPDYDGPVYYYNNSTRAGVLGCVDSYQICESENGPCWSNNNISSIPQAPLNHSATEDENVAALLKLSLDYSTSCGSVQFRQAQALDAQSKITHIQSLPLPTSQWEVETEKMFRTSLARMQANVYDVVRGTASSYEGYRDILDPKYRGLCGLLRIPTTGYTNINFLGLLGIVLAVVTIWSFHLRTFIRKKILKPGVKGVLGVWKWIGSQLGHVMRSKGLLACWSLLDNYVLAPLSRLMMDCC
jgi:hypothetical protein